MLLKKVGTRHGQFKDCVLETMSVGYEMRWYPSEVAASAVFKISSRLPLALRDDALECASFTLVSLLHSSFINKRHRANFFFTADEVEYVREMAWVYGANKLAKEQGAESQHKGSSCARAVSMYQYGLEAAFSAQKAAEAQHRGYAILEGLGLLCRLQGKFFGHRTTRIPSRRALS